MLRVKFTGDKVDFSGKTLLLPSLSTEAPSIALDHIIASNRFKRVGLIEPPYKLMHPSIGYLPKLVSGSDNVLGLPLELYALDNIVILQIRSSVRFGRGKELM